MCSFSKEGEQEDGSLCGCAFASGEVCEEQSFASSMSDIIYRQQPRSPVPMRLLTLALMRNAFLIVLLLGLGVESLATPVTKCALLRSIEVKRPSIVIRGAYLGRVEVWAVPTAPASRRTNTRWSCNARRKSAVGRNEIWLLVRFLHATP